MDEDKESSPSSRYSNKIELVNVPKRKMTIENDSNALFKKRVDKSKKSMLGEKQRKINTIVVDEDAKVTSSL